MDILKVVGLILVIFDKSTENVSIERLGEKI